MKAYFIYLRLVGLYAPIHLVCSLFTLPNYVYSLSLLIRYVVVHNLNHRFNYSQYTQLYYLLHYYVYGCRYLREVLSRNYCVWVFLLHLNNFLIVYYGLCRSSSLSLFSIKIIGEFCIVLCSYKTISGKLYVNYIIININVFQN